MVEMLSRIDNIHYRFYLHLSQPPPVVATLSTLKGTIEIALVITWWLPRASVRFTTEVTFAVCVKRGGSLVPRSALPAEVTFAVCENAALPLPPTLRSGYPFCPKGQL